MTTPRPPMSDAYLLRWRRRFADVLSFQPDWVAIRADVLARNAVRREAALPLLDVDAEVNRLADVQEEATWNQFIQGPYVDRVVRRAVTRYRSRPGHNFNWIVGMGLGSCVSRLMRERLCQVEEMDPDA
jgi:hypothetical protein